MDNSKIKGLRSGCAKIKIKEGQIFKVYEWKEYLNNNKEEVLRSLVQEGVFIESVFLDKQGDENYLIYYMKFQDAEKAKAAFEKSELNVDKYHAQFKRDVWAEKQELELLLEFVNFGI